MGSPPTYQISWRRTDVMRYHVTLTVEQLSAISGVPAADILATDPDDLVDHCALADTLSELDGDDDPVVEPAADLVVCRRTVTIQVI